RAGRAAPAFKARKSPAKPSSAMISRARCRSARIVRPPKIDSATERRQLQQGIVVLKGGQLGIGTDTVQRTCPQAEPIRRERAPARRPELLKAPSPNAFIFLVLGSWGAASK